jgi:hypothetical protein
LKWGNGSPRCVAAELLRHAQRGDVHLALGQDLLAREVHGIVAAEAELHALLHQPLVDALGLCILDLGRGVVERRLAQALLVDARGIEQMIGNDGVEHPHAALVEHPHDGLLTAKLIGQDGPQPPLGTRHLHLAQGDHVAPVMTQLARLQPALETAQKGRVLEVLGPQRGVLAPGLGQRAVEVEHAHQPRPLPRPVGDVEDRPAM